MTWKRLPGADQAEGWAGVEGLSLPHHDDAQEYIWKAVADYDRARRSEDELRQLLQACVLLLSEAGADLADGIRHNNSKLLHSIDEVMQSVAQLSRRTDGT